MTDHEAWHRGMGRARWPLAAMAILAGLTWLLNAAVSGGVAASTPDPAPTLEPPPSALRDRPVPGPLSIADLIAPDFTPAPALAAPQSPAAADPVRKFKFKEGHITVWHSRPNDVEEVVRDETSSGIGAVSDSMQAKLNEYFSSITGTLNLAASMSMNYPRELEVGKSYDFNLSGSGTASTSGCNEWFMVFASVDYGNVRGCTQSWYSSTSEICNKAWSASGSVVPCSVTVWAGQYQTSLNFNYSMEIYACKPGLWGSCSKGPYLSAWTTLTYTEDLPTPADRATLEGYVVASNRMGLADVEVELSRAGEAVGRALTDGSGWYSFKNVVPGDGYVLSATLRNASTSPPAFRLLYPAPFGNLPVWARTLPFVISGANKTFQKDLIFGHHIALEGRPVSRRRQVLRVGERGPRA